MQKTYFWGFWPNFMLKYTKMAQMWPFESLKSKVPFCVSAHPYKKTGQNGGGQKSIFTLFFHLKSLKWCKKSLKIAILTQIYAIICLCKLAKVQQNSTISSKMDHFQRVSEPPNTKNFVEIWPPVDFVCTKSIQQHFWTIFMQKQSFTKNLFYNKGVRTCHLLTISASILTRSLVNRS